MSHVEVAATALLREVARVLHEAVGTAAKELFRGVVDRVRVGVGGMERHATAITFLSRDLQSAVTGVGYIGAELNRSECRIGNDASRRTRCGEELLVEIEQRGEIRPLGSDVVGRYD